MNEEQNINQLPKDWKWVKLGDVCEKMSNGANAKQSDDKIGFPISRIETIWNETIDLSRVKYIEENDTAFVEKYSLKKDDILFSHINSDIHLGKTAIFKNQTKTLIQGINLLLIRLNKDALADFFNYQFRYKRRRGEFISIAQKSVNQSSINQPKLKNMDFVLPPKPTQQAIVSKIEELFSELDKGIENLRTAQQQLRVYRQSVLKWAFEGRLTNEIVKAGELPRKWRWVSIDFLLYDKKKGMGTGPFGTMLKKSEHQKIGVPVLGIENIGEGIFQMPNKIFVTDKKAIELKSFMVKENDIIISRSGTVGEICLLPKKMENSIISTNLIRVSLNLEIINPKYFVYLFQGGKVRQQVFNLCKGSSRAFLNQTILNSLDFPYCSIVEQNQIIQEIESRFSVADKMEETITQSLRQAEVLRQSILKKAFEGKLLPTEIQSIKATQVKVFPIERKVLAAKIIHLNHDKKHFGLTKFQKLFYLIENYAEVEYDTNFLKETAGPYDREFTLAFRKEMKANNWFEEEQKGSITKFRPKENVGSVISAYAKYFGDKSKKIVFVLKQLQEKDTHESELIATLYAVWNNRLIKNKLVKINYLIEDFFNWSPKKKEEFHTEEVIATYNWIKKVKLLPTGFGKSID